MKEEVSCDRKRKLVLRGISVPFSAAGGSGPILRPFHTRFPAFPSLRGKPAPLCCVPLRQLPGLPGTVSGAKQTGKGERGLYPHKGLPVLSGCGITQNGWEPK